MVTPKTWTAHDLDLGPLKINRTSTEDGNPGIQFEQRYQYKNGIGILEGVAGSRLVDVIELTDIPPNILSALSAIEAYMYNKCLEKEGMR